MHNLDLLHSFVFIGGMAWPYPQYSRNKVDRAGIVLLENNEWSQYLLWDDLDEALDVINNWRSSHAYPLQVIKMNLKRRAKAIDPKALVYQRQKRIEAIKLKMLRNRANGHEFGLSTMQDLGGCRAIMRSVKQVELLQERYTDLDRKNRGRGSILYKANDYIKCPKKDGYRGIHLVYKYRHQTHSRGSKANTKIDVGKFDGLRIEIQLRSILQHQWASAVETAGRYSRQNIKGGGSDAKWARFFSLTSSAIAIIEDRPLVPDTPTLKADLRKEILKHHAQIELLKHYAAAKNVYPADVFDFGADSYILVVDPDSGRLEAKPFQKKRMLEAQSEYLLAEKSIRHREGVEAVLVGVDSPDQLKIAYPSYYLDARDFVKTIEAFID